MSRWASRVNNNSLEWLVALVRVVSVLCAAGFFAFAFVVFWVTSDHARGAATASWIACAGMAAGLGWWSWVQMGNREWAPSRMCPAVWGELRCNVQVDKNGQHEGKHQDGLRDPEGARLWS